MANTPEERLDELVNQPASASSPDGSSASNQPIPDIIKLADRKAAQEALAGSNPQGGRRSPWGAAARMSGIFVPRRG